MERDVERKSGGNDVNEEWSDAWRRRKTGDCEMSIRNDKLWRDTMKHSEGPQMGPA